MSILVDCKGTNKKRIFQNMKNKTQINICEEDDDGIVFCCHLGWDDYQHD